MRKLLLLLAAGGMVCSMAQANLVTSPDFSALDGVWEGFEGAPVFASVTPSTFVSVNSGTATVTASSANEFNFYQTFGAGPAGNAALVPGTSYNFTIDSSNITTDGAPVAFVKAFDGSWGFLEAEYQFVPLSGGTETINFTAQAGTAYYQVGVFDIGRTSGSFDVSSPSLTAVPEPSTFALLGGLFALGFVVYRRRKQA